MRDGKQGQSLIDIGHSYYLSRCTISRLSAEHCEQPVWLVNPRKHYKSYITKTCGPYEPDWGVNRAVIDLVPFCGRRVPTGGLSALRDGPELAGLRAGI